MHATFSVPPALAVGLELIRSVARQDPSLDIRVDIRDGYTTAIDRTGGHARQLQLAFDFGEQDALAAVREIFHRPPSSSSLSSDARKLKRRACANPSTKSRPENDQQMQLPIASTDGAGVSVTDRVDSLSGRVIAINLASRSLIVAAPFCGLSRARIFFPDGIELADLGSLRGLRVRFARRYKTTAKYTSTPADVADAWDLWRALR